MTTKKVTITIPEEILAEASVLAEKAGLPFSTWLAQTVAHAVRIERGLAAMQEWEAEHGAFTDEEVAWADAQIAQAEAGVRADANHDARDEGA